MFTKTIVFLILLFFAYICGMNDSSTPAYCPNKRSDPSVLRKKRHLVFPDKSTVVLTMSLVKAIMVHAPSGWNIALELDVVYNLPDIKHTLELKHRKKLHHRQKRELWDKLSDALFIRNVNGECCLMRSVCEAQQLLAPPGRSLVHDILRAIFTLTPEDYEQLGDSASSYSPLLSDSYCKDDYLQNECPISLIHYILFLNQDRH